MTSGLLHRSVNRPLIGHSIRVEWGLAKLRSSKWARKRTLYYDEIGVRARNIDTVRLLIQMGRPM